MSTAHSVGGSRVGECAGGSSGSPEQRRELIVRRRQLVDHRTAVKKRLEQAHTTLVRNSVRKSIEGIDKDLKRIDRAIIQLVESNDDRRGRYERLKSVPQGGARTAARLMAELLELGRLNRRQGQSRSDGRGSSSRPPCAGGLSSQTRSSTCHPARR